MGRGPKVVHSTAQNSTSRSAALPWRRRTHLSTMRTRPWRIIAVDNTPRSVRSPPPRPRSSLRWTATWFRYASFSALIDRPGATSVLSFDLYLPGRVSTSSSWTRRRTSYRTDIRQNIWTVCSILPLEAANNSLLCCNQYQMHMIALFWEVIYYWSMWINNVLTVPLVDILLHFREGSLNNFSTIMHNLSGASWQDRDSESHAIFTPHLLYRLQNSCVLARICI